MSATEPKSEHSVLLIEDNPDHAELVSTLLSECSYITHVTTLADGAAALRFVAEQPTNRLPAAVLLDLKLPRVDGSEVLRAMRAAPAWRQVPVIILTTSTARSDVAQCRAYGATAYLTKMAAPDLLGAQIHRAMDHWVASQPPDDSSGLPDALRGPWYTESGF